MTWWDAEEREVDLLDGSIDAGDPDETHAWLRTFAPVFHDQVNDVWALSRHTDVVAAATDGERFAPLTPPGPVGEGGPDDEHEAFVRAQVDGLLDELAPRGGCDLVHDVLRPLGAASAARLPPTGRHGLQATGRVAAGAALALLERPEQHRLLVARPELLDAAVEEFVRWVTPLASVRRRTTTAVSLHDVDIPAGAEVLLLLRSANRDEAVFDAPVRFEVTRTPNPHVGFGPDPACAGAERARLELRVLFESVLGRFPDLQLAPGGATRTAPDPVARPVTSLPVRFGVIPDGKA